MTARKAKAAADNRPPLTVAQAAARLGLHRQRVYELIHQRRIGCITHEGFTGDRPTYSIPAAEVDRYLTDHYREATA